MWERPATLEVALPNVDRGGEPRATVAKDSPPLLVDEQGRIDVTAESSGVDRSSSSIVAIVVSCVVVVCVIVVALVSGSGDEDGFDLADAGPGDSDLSYLIPPGAGAALDAGQPLEIMPVRVEVSVGDVIEIVNQDDRDHLIGPFFVGAGETVRQEFASAGEYVGACSVSPTGEIVVVVT